MKYLGSLIGVERRKLSRAIEAHLKPSAAWAETHINLLSSKEWLETSHPDVIEKFGRLLYYADGTVFDIFQPTDRPYARATFSAKHKTNALNVFIVVSDSGRIVFASHVYTGVMTDCQMWEKSGIVQKLEELYNFPPGDPAGEGRIPHHIEIGGEEYEVLPAMAGDKGYVLAKIPKDWEFWITQSGVQELEAHGAVCPPGVRFSADLAPFRSLVERVIQRVKNYRGLSNKFNNARGKHKKWYRMWKIACAMVNWRVGQAEPAEDE